MVSVSPPLDADRRNPVAVLLWPGVMTLAMLAMLLALGTWQVKRLAWKDAILARIAAAERAPAVPLTAGDPQPFQKVLARGHFLPGTAALFGVEVRDGRTGPVMGSQLLTGLRMDDGAVVLVDRGWIPGSDPNAVPPPPGEVAVAGFAHAPEHARFFGAADDLARRQFFTLDPGRIGAALGLAHVEPYTLVALGPAAPGVVPEPAQHLPRPENNHLIYALTWFSLAGGLLVVFLSWAREQIRKGAAP